MAMIAGWAHSRFGRLDGVSIYDLVKEVTEGALATPGSTRRTSTRSSSRISIRMDGQGFSAALPATVVPALRMKRAVRVENACASGSAAYNSARGSSTLRKLESQVRNARRGLVNALEVLLWFEETFDGAAWALLRLAVAENETWK